MPHLDTLTEVLPRNVRTQEPTRERVPCPVRIHDQLVRDRRHRIHFSFRIRLVDEDRRFGALGNHHDARTLVGLGIRRDALGDLRDVGRVGFENGFGVLLGFGFVPDDDVGVGEDLLQLGSEELEDEGRGEVEGQGLRVRVRCDEGGRGGSYLVVVRRVLAQLEHRVNAVREEEPLDVKHLGTLHEWGNLRRREMRHLELLGGTQRRHQRPNRQIHRVNDPLHEKRGTDNERRKEKSLPIVAREDHSTGTRFLALLDEVNLIQPFPLVRRPQLLSEIVIADASRVHHRLGREDVLRVE